MTHGSAADPCSGDSQIVFSGRRDGFALYFARLVRPMWRAQIVKKGFVLRFGIWHQADQLYPLAQSSWETRVECIRLYTGHDSEESGSLALVPRA